MLSFTTREFLFRKTETWFYCGESIPETAYNVYPYAECALKVKYDKKTEEETTVLDLSLSIGELFAGINATFRYHIRRAENMGFVYRVNDAPLLTECIQLSLSLQRFAENRNFDPLSLKRILAIREQNALVVMQLVKNGEIAVTHLYLGDKRRAVLLSSFHSEKITDKRLQSYANKFLHWNAILFFKQKQYSIYDFGGINKLKVPGITRFKLSFGGRTVMMQNYIRVKPFLRPIFKLLGKI